MTHQKRRAPDRELAESAVEVVLRLGVESGRRLVENEDGRVPHQSSGERQLLPFTFRELPTTELAPEGGVQTLGQRAQ